MIATMLIGLLGFVVAFGLAVFVHELGHFLAAKAFGVPVERFVIGFDKEAMPLMPKCIWERKIGETTYGLSLMPLGGYVKMIGTIHPEIEQYFEDAERRDEEKRRAKAGEAPAEAPAEKPKSPSLSEQAVMDQGALYKKPFWQKVIIYSAGVTMNLVLAAAVVAFAAAKGQMVDAPLPTVVSWQPADSWITEQGLQQGDRIVAVDGTGVTNDEEFWTVLSESGKLREAVRADLVVSLDIARAGETFEKTLTVPPDTEPSGTSPRAAFGGMFARPAAIDYVIANRPADRAGMKRGDIVLAVDGQPIADWNHLFHTIRGSLGSEITVDVLRNGETLTLAMSPMESTDEAGVGQVGIIPGNPDKVYLRVPVGTAIARSPGIVWNNTKRYAANLKKIGGRLVQGEVNKVRQDLGGPVAIAQLAGRHANLGLSDYLNFLVMLNIALAVMNILPLPVLDGGHIVLAAFEAVFRRPVPPRILVPVLNWAVIGLLAFVALVTFSDITKWLGLG